MGLLESGQAKKSGRLNPPLPPLSSRSNFRETNPNREEWREVKWVARPLRQFDVPTRLIQNSAIALPESVILQLMSDIVSCPKFHHPGIEVGRKVWDYHPDESGQIQARVTICSEEEKSKRSLQKTLCFTNATDREINRLADKGGEIARAKGGYDPISNNSIIAASKLGTALKFKNNSIIPIRKELASPSPSRAINGGGRYETIMPVRAVRGNTYKGYLK